MTGIYLFGLTPEGKRGEPKEIEYLNREELDHRFAKAEPEDIIDFLEAVCQRLVETEKFLTAEGYVKVNPLDDTDFDSSKSATEEDKDEDPYMEPDVNQFTS